MSATTLDQHHDAPVPTEDTTGLSKLAPAGGLLGLVGIIASIALVAMPGTRQAMLGSYLFGWFFWMTITLGFFGLALLHYTVRGSWALPLIRQYQAGSGPNTFLAMAALFLPVLAFMPTLYEWADSAALNGPNSHFIHHKAPYLNIPFFLIRFVIFFGSWAWLSGFLTKSTNRQDQNRDFKLESGRSSWGAAGLVFFVITITFAFTDWVMSIDTTWFSTIYGVWLLCGAGLGGLALTVVLFCVNRDKEPFRSVITPNLTKDMGNMLFVFTLLWAYTSLSQFLIIWNGNLPEFTGYYRARSEMGWNAIGMALIVGQFLLPFMWLLAPRAKRVPSLLAKIAGWIFVMHLIDVYMVVVPSLPTGTEHHRSPGTNLWMDLLALIGVGGVWFLIFVSRLGKAPLMPLYDNRLQEAKKHAH